MLQAAIASLYAEAPAYDQTDWAQILVLYDRLLQVWPSPVVALNRAVPLAMVAGLLSRWPRQYQDVRRGCRSHAVPAT